MLLAHKFVQRPWAHPVRQRRVLIHAGRKKIHAAYLSFAVIYLTVNYTMASGTVKAFEKVVKNHFFEFFSSGACAYCAASTECRESLAAQALFADLPHMSPNPNKAIRGCGPLSTLGFFDRLGAVI